MKTQMAIIMAQIFGILFSQLEMNYSYEMKYGDGKEVRGQASNNPYTTDYSYFENLLDINTYLGNNIYIYTQLEYSNPPLYGYSRTGIDSILSTYYVEYSNDKLNMKLGDIYELYGRGLSFYTMQDQVIDYNNSLKGLSFNYFIRNNLKISGLIGNGEYAFRSSPTNRKTDYKLGTNALFGSIDYENQWSGFFHYSYLKQESFLSSDLITRICSEEYYEVGKELNIRADIDALSCTQIPDTLGTDSDNISSKNHNFSWNYVMGPFDIHMDKSWIYYDKIHGNEVFGSRFYTSLYTELFETGITYEYKNYYTPYLIKSLSNPPIVYREGSSILASRSVHSINFGNEIGHQIDLNRNINGKLNIFANLSLSHRHQMGDMEPIGLLDILSMKDENEMYEYYPFRQIYLEINGWALSERLYYKAGMDRFIEFTVLNDSKNTYVTTIPTQWVWKLTDGNSLTMYLETQEKTVKQLSSNFTLSYETKYINNYSSISYSHLGKWIVTGYYDQEVKDSKTNTWLGADLSYKISSETQVSLFYGSQKGGLVCANGICAEQPGFEDGVKITFRSLF